MSYISKKTHVVVDSPVGLSAILAQTPPVLLPNTNRAKILTEEGPCDCVGNRNQSTCFFMGPPLLSTRITRDLKLYLGTHFLNLLQELSTSCPDYPAISVQCSLQEVRILQIFFSTTPGNKVQKHLEQAEDYAKFLTTIVVPPTL